MTARRYRHTWGEIAALDCDYIASWGALDPDSSHTIDFDDDSLPRLAFKMAGDGQSFSATYQMPTNSRGQQADFTHSRIELVRRPCRFGGTRAYFLCPGCGRTTLRLAVLPGSLLCGSCGGVTWDSRRQRPLQRLMRKGDKIALRLGCGSWWDVPVKKPAHMHRATFEALRAEHAKLAADINREIGRRLVRAQGGMLGQLGALVKLGV